MTDLLDQVLKATRNLSAARRDEIAELVLRLVDEGDEVIVLPSDEKAAIARSKAAAARGEFANDEQVCAVWASRREVIEGKTPALTEMHRPNAATRAAIRACRENRTPRFSSPVKMFDALGKLDHDGQRKLPRSS